MKNIYVYIGKYIIYEMYMLIWKMYLFTYTGNFIMFEYEHVYTYSKCIYIYIYLHR